MAKPRLTMIHERITTYFHKDLAAKEKVNKY